MSDLKPIRPYRPFLGKRGFKPLYQWEGVVEEVNGDSFRARLRPFHEGRAEASRVEYADFDYTDLGDESDLEFVTEGAVFYWTVGKSRNAAGTYTNTSLLRFRRLPPSTSYQTREAGREAEALWAELGGDATPTAQSEEDPSFVALQEMFDRNGADVYRYALGVLHHKEEAEDITKEAFRRLYRALKEDTLPENPRVWLIKVAHHLVRNRLARPEQLAEVVPPEDLTEGDSGDAGQEDPGLGEVLLSLERLPFNQRSAIVMRVQGRTHKEIADVLGVSRVRATWASVKARRTVGVELDVLRDLEKVSLPASLDETIGSSS